MAHGQASYWRAVITAQLGDRERSMTLLHDALANGSPFRRAIHVYVFLGPLHGYPPFEELIKPKG